MGKLKITLADLFEIPEAEIFNPDAYRPVSNVTIDSRKVVKNSLFFAIKGEKFDGHKFIEEALKRGAKALVINKKNLRKFNFVEIPLIAVPDTTLAFGQMAAIYRKKLNAKVLAVTGSNGKTSTKDMIATLLSEKFDIVKTEANNNNHIGVPLTIFEADENCQVLVLEHGTNHFGEIPYSSKISQPDFGLITNIGESHIEFLKDVYGVFKEKSALLNETMNNGGTVFINTDDEIIFSYSKFYPNRVTYGFNSKSDVKGKILKYDEAGRPKIQIRYHDKSFEVLLPLLGKSNAQNFLAAAAVGLKFGLTAKQIISGAKKIYSTHGRLEIKNVKNVFLIDDTYNASPASVKAAVEAINNVKIYKSKYIILGDIFELGNKAPKIHRELALLFSSKNHIVFTVGDLMKNLHKELRKNNVKSIHFFSREALSLYLKYEEIENSVILVKGSRGMKMEEFVQIIEERFA